MSEQRRWYGEVQDLLESHGGKMTWHAGGHGGGGKWKLFLENRTTEIVIRDFVNLNALDKMYVMTDEEPVACVHPYRLKDEAFWMMVDLFD